VAIDRPRRNGDSADNVHPTHPGEPGVGVDLAPPFVAGDDETRWLFSLNRMGIRPGLKRIEGLLEEIGNPETKVRTLIVAGTNGKGSTTRILAHLLRAAGYKVATYTSPHLLNVHERIMVDDKPVAEDDFAARVKAIRPHVEKHEASWFETLTALSVQIAADAGADFLCCETGLGGRLDATNALPSVGTLFTTVGIDHQRILGNTRQEIASEKLGLLKRGIPAFCAFSEDLRAQVFMASVTAGSPCYFLDELAHWDPVAGGAWDLTLRDRVYSSLPNLGHAPLRRNVALALLALTELESRLGLILVPDDPGVVLGNLFLPGRYQTVLKDPEWIFDTAHNDQALQGTLGAFAATRTSGRKFILFGAMHDKTLTEDAGSLLMRFDGVLGTPVALPRSRNAVELSEVFVGWGLNPKPWQTDFEDIPACTAAPDMDHALQCLARGLKPEDRVLVIGSCFTVAEAFYRLGLTNLEQTRSCHQANPILENILAQV